MNQKKNSFFDSESSETYAEPFFKVCPKLGGAGPIGGFWDGPATWEPYAF